MFNWPRLNPKVDQNRSGKRSKMTQNSQKHFNIQKFDFFVVKRFLQVKEYLSTEEFCLKFFEKAIFRVGFLVLLLPDEIQIRPLAAQSYLNYLKLKGSV